MAKQRFKPAEVAAALKETKGMVYIAARRLGCDPDTILNYCRRYPEVEAVKNAQRGEMIDEAELRLWHSIQNGEAWGITLCLRTLGKDRGYVEQQKLALTDPSGEQSWAPTVGLAVLLEAARTGIPASNGHPVPQLPEAAEDA